MIPALIVPVLANPSLLYRMLGSLDHEIEHLIVIDNGRCVDPTLVPWQDHVRRFSLIPMPANLGVAGSWNLGIKSAPFADWWLIANFDVLWPAGSLCRFESEVARGSLCLSAASPPWAAFALASETVQTVGLFDESLHPAYFEDNDYERRCRHAGIPVVQTTIPVHHDNSSTLSAGYHEVNNRTYAANLDYWNRKQHREDYTEGRWNLTIRRRNSWD